MNLNIKQQKDLPLLTSDESTLMHIRFGSDILRSLSSVDFLKNDLK